MSPCDAFGWEPIAERMVYIADAFTLALRRYPLVVHRPRYLIVYGLGVKGRNRDLVRMLVNGLFWIAVGVIGLAIWTSTVPNFR